MEAVWLRFAQVAEEIDQRIGAMHAVDDIEHRLKPRLPPLEIEGVVVASEQVACLSLKAVAKRSAGQTCAQRSRKWVRLAKCRRQTKTPFQTKASQLRASRRRCRHCSTSDPGLDPPPGSLSGLVSPAVPPHIEGTR